MISAQNISKDFGTKRVLHNISFDILRGEVVGLLGPNGAGKTTLIRILTGFFPPTEGKVTLDEVDLLKNPKKMKRQIGYLPERLSLYPDMTGDEFLKFVAEIRGIPRRKKKAEIDEKMDLTGLGEVRGRLIGHFSKGFLQRLGLAQALIGDPDVLILDEPTNGLDPKQTVEIRELIRRLGRDRTLILSTHLLPEVSKVCERVLILNQGRIVARGRPDELEEELRDRQEILVKVGQKGDSIEKEFEAALEKVFRSMPGIESFQKVEKEGKNPVMLYLLRTARDGDLCGEVSKQIVRAGFPLLELAVQHLSLEDIFVKLMVSEKVEEPK